MPSMQERSASQASLELQRLLVAGQAADGGWPYYAGRSSRIEPTCWAAIALATLSGSPSEALTRAQSFLHRLQQKNGLLVETAVPGANYAWNGLALLADISVGGAPGGPWRQALIDGLLAVRGIALEQDGSTPVRQNNRLQAWSWIDGTFSWIEPTALCVLALKKSGASGASFRTRMAEAEAMVLDRVCEGGGWNYGNAQVLGQDLRPYVPTTALAVLAMQDRRSHPAVSASLAWLKAHAVSEPATMALSLAAVCLQVMGEPADTPREALVRHEVATRAFGNFHLTAMALFALTVPQHGARAFRLA
jgi:hypothetical protein